MRQLDQGLTTQIFYSQPIVGIGFMFFLMTVYLMKYTTDVLGMSALAVGGILMVCRIWDAVSDPMVGYLSDNTRSSIGRRRPWIAGSALPLAATYVMLWCPPGSLSAGAVTIWFAVSVILFYTAWTALSIPHFALGAELSDAYHMRTRIFGFRHAFGEIGSLLAVLAMFLLYQAEDPRNLMLTISLVAGVVTALLVLIMVMRVRERAEFQGRGETRIYRAFGEVFRNPHARLLLTVSLLASVGQTFSAVLTPYVAEYIVGAPEAVSGMLFVYVIGSIVGVPLWVILSRRFGKRNLWMAGEMVIACCLGSLFFLDEGAILHMGAVLFVIGLGVGAVNVVGASIQSDVIDYGEYATGKRTEGAYFAVWNFMGKVAAGLTFMVAGVVLDLTGFVPNEVQSEATRFWMRFGFAIIPFAFFATAALLLTRFRMTEAEHGRIGAILAERRQSSLDTETAGQAKAQAEGVENGIAGRAH